VTGPTGPWRGPAPRSRDPEAGQISLLILGLALIAVVLVIGAAGVTSAQLSRMRLLDVADGAALDAADSFAESSYHEGLGRAVPLTDETVQATATAYVASRPLPPWMLEWHVAEGTGSPDGETAVVRVRGTAQLPFVGRVLSALDHPVTITVESRARAELAP
jgi:hypothetical protein